MGNGILTSLAASPTQTPSAPEQLNQVISALEGDILPRDLTGVVASAAGNVGAPATPFKTGYFQKLQIDGQPIAPPTLSGTAVNSGAATADGFPAFLSPIGTAVQVLGATTPLNVVINGTGFLLSVDLTSHALTLAPGSNNTCVINDVLFNGNQASKTVGEYGYWITVASMGSAISALIGKVAAFQYGSEIFLATVNSSTQITPIYRGIGGTVQSALTNSGTITLLKAAWIFLGNDMLTINPVYDYPTWSATAPAAPATNDHWWDVTSLTWKTWNGAAWVVSNEVYLGMAICNTTACAAVEPEDFNISWDATIDFKEIYASTTTLTIKGPIIYSAMGKQITISTDQILAYSSATPNWIYIYGDVFGNLFVSTVPPRNNKKRKGYYLPGSYKRLIGIAYNYSTGLAASRMTADGWIEESASTPQIMRNFSGNGSFTSNLSFDSVCPIADEITIFCYHVPHSGAVEVTLISISTSATNISVFSVLGTGQLTTNLFESGVINLAYSTSDTANNLTLYFQRGKISL